MKIDLLKNKLGMNLIAILGWFSLILFIYMYVVTYPTLGICLYVLFETILVGLFLLVYFIEIIFKHQIKNKFILCNKLYHIFFVLGLLLSLLLVLFCIKIIIIGI